MATTNTNNASGDQQGTETAPETPELGAGTGAPADAPNSPEGNGDGQETSPDDDPTDATAAGLRAEAAKYRTRAKAAEARAESAERAIVQHALATTQLDQRLWDAAGVDLDTLRDESGALSVQRVTTRAAELRAEFGLAPTGVPKPNVQQGNPPGGEPKPTGMASAFAHPQRR